MFGLVNTLGNTCLNELVRKVELLNLVHSWTVKDFCELCMSEQSSEHWGFIDRPCVVIQPSTALSKVFRINYLHYFTIFIILWYAACSK